MGIDFHCDGGYASSTLQIPLLARSNADGGRLCFFVNDQLHFPELSPGRFCVHPPTVLHAVTALAEGAVRKSLFVVDYLNGLGENGTGDGVIEISETMVKRFLRATGSGAEEAGNGGDRHRAVGRGSDRGTRGGEGLFGCMGQGNARSEAVSTWGGAG